MSCAEHDSYKVFYKKKMFAAAVNSNMPHRVDLSHCCSDSTVMVSPTDLALRAIINLG